MSDGDPVNLEGIEAGYGRGAALHDVSVTIPAGTLTVLLGANGAGKSTLLRVVAGLVRPTRGRVRVRGDDLADLARGEIARRIALVPQRSASTMGFTVEEIVAMGRAPHQRGRLVSGTADREAVARALEACELGGLRDRALESLSGGEQQRVHVARALAQEAPILLLDEAAAHLDIRHATRLFELVRRELAARAVTCIAAVHDLATAGRFADRAIVLREGTVLAAGARAAAMTEATLSAAFATSIKPGETADGHRFFVPA